MDQMLAICMIAGTLLGIFVLVLIIIFKDIDTSDNDN